MFIYLTKNILHRFILGYDLHFVFQALLKLIHEDQTKGKKLIKYHNILPTNTGKHIGLLIKLLYFKFMFLFFSTYFISFSEKFKTLSINSFCFKDTFAFLANGLDVLAQDYLENGSNYEILKKSILTKTNSVFDKEKFLLCLRKLKFPHE